MSGWPAFPTKSVMEPMTYQNDSGSTSSARRVSVTVTVGNAGQPDIVSADAFGWYPSILAGNPTDGGDQVVAPGDDVDPGTGGFLDAELLASVDSAADAAGGTYAATAGLLLETPSSVTPGGYSATITLTLLQG